MDNQVDLRKKVVNSYQFNRLIDREFRTFVPPVEESPLTLEEFFKAYNDLYFAIDLKGETNSHEYLARKSSELIDFEKDTTDIEPLLDEITSLRERLLEANIRITELENQNLSNLGNT